MKPPTDAQKAPPLQLPVLTEVVQLSKPSDFEQETIPGSLLADNARPQGVQNLRVEPTLESVVDHYIPKAAPGFSAAWWVPDDETTVIYAAPMPENMPALALISTEPAQPLSGSQTDLFAQQVLKRLQQPLEAMLEERVQSALKTTFERATLDLMNQLKQDMNGALKAMIDATITDLKNETH
jgi:hypothetical protein